MKLVCDDCMKQGLADSCKHKLGELPHWQQKGRHADIQRLMDKESDTFVTEMRGVAQNNMITPAFDPEGIRLMENNRYVHDGSEIKHIYVGLDPAAGGAKSDYAIVSCFETKDRKIVICGAEAGKYKLNTDCARLLINHMLALRREIPGAESAREVFMPESNLAFETLWVSDEIRRSGMVDVCIMREDAQRAGMKTTRQTKELMATALNMKVVKRDIRVMKNLVVTDANRSQEDVTDELFRQLREYSRIVKPPRDPQHSQPTVSFSGKSGAGHDDLAIAVQLVVTMHPFFWAKPEYKHWR